jgi:hypothetical protein
VVARGTQAGKGEGNTWLGGQFGQLKARNHGMPFCWPSCGVRLSSNLQFQTVKMKSEFFMNF